MCLGWVVAIATIVVVQNMHNFPQAQLFNMFLLALKHVLTHPICGIPSWFLQKKLVSSRASSAVDKDIRVAYRDRLISFQEARPSTTHAFRVFFLPLYSKILTLHIHDRAGEKGHSSLYRTRWWRKLETIRVTIFMFSNYHFSTESFQVRIINWCL